MSPQIPQYSSNHHLCGRTQGISWTSPDRLSEFGLPEPPGVCENAYIHLCFMIIYDHVCKILCMYLDDFIHRIKHLMFYINSLHTSHGNRQIKWGPKAHGIPTKQQAFAANSSSDRWRFAEQCSAGHSTFQGPDPLGCRGNTFHRAGCPLGLTHLDSISVGRSALLPRLLVKPVHHVRKASTKLLHGSERQSQAAIQMSHSIYSLKI